MSLLRGSVTGAHLAYKIIRAGNTAIVKNWTPIVGKGQASGLGIAVEVGTGVGIWLSDYFRSSEDGSNIIGTPFLQGQYNRLGKTRGARKSTACERRFGKNHKYCISKKHRRY